RDDQPSRDLLGREALGEEGEHLELPRGQAGDLPRAGGAAKQPDEADDLPAASQRRERGVYCNRASGRVRERARERDVLATAMQHLLEGLRERVGRRRRDGCGGLTSSWSACPM